MLEVRLQLKTIWNLLLSLPSMFEAGGLNDVCASVDLSPQNVLTELWTCPLSGWHSIKQSQAIQVQHESSCALQVWHLVKQWSAESCGCDRTHGWRELFIRLLYPLLLLLPSVSFCLFLWRNLHAGFWSGLNLEHRLRVVWVFLSP